MTGPPYAPTIPNMIRYLAERHGDREALVRGDRRVTFAGLERESAALAKGLLARGLGKGSRIGLMMPNSPDWAAVFVAAARIGAIVIPMSTLYQAPEMRYVIGHADLGALVIAPRYLRHDYIERLERAFPDLRGQGRDRLVLQDAPHLRSILVWGDVEAGWATAPAALVEAAANEPRFDDRILAAVEASVTPADHACIIYTSGSTAEPKGVVHNHGPLVRHSYQMAADFWPLGEGDRIGSVRPFFWVAGLSATLFHSLHNGGCLIYVDPDTPAEVRRLIEEDGLTALTGTAAWMAGIDADAAFADRRYRILRIANDCSGVAEAQGAGYAFRNPRLGRLVAGRALPFPNALIPKNFGMTETLGSHTAEPAPALIPAQKQGAIGRVVPGVVQRIVDPQTRRALPPGELGELLVRGYSLMDGLYKRERQTVFDEEGLYPTGDLCTLDEDGYLYFTGRAREMVKVHGANVAPLEVEAVLDAMDEIERSAVVGLPIGDGDSLLVAAVTPRGSANIDEATLLQRLKGQLSSYKVPKRIFFMTEDELPVTGSGKIKKPELAEQLGALVSGAAKSG